MQRVNCRLDQKNWQKVLKLLGDVFANADIHVLVYTIKTWSSGKVLKCWRWIICRGRNRTVSWSFPAQQSLDGNGFHGVLQILSGISWRRIYSISWRRAQTSAFWATLLRTNPRYFYTQLGNFISSTQNLWLAWVNFYNVSPKSVVGTMYSSSVSSNLTSIPLNNFIINSSFNEVFCNPDVAFSAWSSELKLYRQISIWQLPS